MSIFFINYYLLLKIFSFEFAEKCSWYRQQTEMSQKEILNSEMQISIFNKMIKRKKLKKVKNC